MSTRAAGYAARTENGTRRAVNQTRARLVINAETAHAWRRDAAVAAQTAEEVIG